MADKIKNTIVVLEPTTEVVEEFLSSLEKRQQVEIIRSQSHEEVNQLTKQFQPCMVVACIHGPGHIPSRTDLLKKLEGSIKYGLIKTLIVSKDKNRQLSSTFTGLGVTDYIEEPVPVRTLQFKANLQLKAIETVRRQQELKKASQEKIVFKTSADGAAGSVNTNTAKPAPALSLAQDFFLFRNAGMKKVGKKMMLELEGPDPASGQWVEHKGGADDKPRWLWHPVGEEEAAKRGDGWMHEGDKPLFQEKTGRWSFASEKPRLGFRQAGKEIAAKVTTDEKGQVSVAADSQAAEKNIKKSRETAIMIRQEKILEEERVRAEAAERKKAAELSRADAIAEADREAEERAAAEQAAKKPKRVESFSDDEAAELPAGKSAKAKTARSENESAAAEGGDGSEEKSGKPEDLSTQLDFLKKKSKGATANGDATEEETATVKTGKAIDPVEERSARARAGAKAEDAEIPEGGQQAKSRDKSVKGKTELAPEKAQLSGEDDERAGSPVSRKGSGLEPLEIEATEPGQAAKKERASKERDQGLTEEEEQEQRAELARKKKEERARKRKEIYEQIQAVLAEPVPASLSEEAEAEMRRELDIPADQPISARDLARKSRLKRIQKLKEKLLDFGEESDTDDPSYSVHDLSEEKKERRGSWDPQSQEKLKGIRGHSDADLGNAEEAGTTPQAKKRRKAAGLSLLPEHESAGAETQSETLENLFQKEKKSAGTDEKKPPARAKNTSDEMIPVKQSPYLGIFVSVSNALASSRDKRKALARVLKSIEMSFEHCEACFTGLPDESGKLAPQEITATGEAQPKRMVNLSTGYSEAIIRKSGETAEILGYLHLNPSGERLQFQRGEKEALQKVASMLWPLVHTMKGSGNKDKKAA